MGKKLIKEEIDDFGASLSPVHPYFFQDFHVTIMLATVHWFRRLWDFRKPVDEALVLQNNVVCDINCFIHFSRVARHTLRVAPRSLSISETTDHRE